ncbi:MAG: hypothetical protein ABSB41_10575 [Anaerolineales bacterium]
MEYKLQIRIYPVFLEGTLVTTFHATSQLYWISAFIAFLLDAGLVLGLVWGIKRPRFDRLKWPLSIAAFFFWGGLWGWAMWDPFIWHTAYQYVFPSWARYANPILFSILNALLALLFWWITRHIKGYPILNFCLLGGLESFPGHLRAIFSLGILNTPLLKTVSAAAALTFGFFEFGFYWCGILILAAGIEWIWRRTHLGQPSSVKQTGA